MNIFPTKILLATDGSREAILAAHTAVDLADKTGSELHVAFILRTQDASEYRAVGFYTENTHEEIKQMGQRLLDEQVKRVEAAGGTVAGAHFRMARPDEGILAVGEDIGTGLIVLGSRGLGGMRHAHCPVLVVRKEDEPGQQETDQEMLLA